MSRRTPHRHRDGHRAPSLRLYRKVRAGGRDSRIAAAVRKAEYMYSTSFMVMDHARTQVMKGNSGQKSHDGTLTVSDLAVTVDVDARCLLKCIELLIQPLLRSLSLFSSGDGLLLHDVLESH